MSCPLCGEVCGCEVASAPPPRGETDAGGDGFRPLDSLGASSGGTAPSAALTPGEAAVATSELALPDSWGDPALSWRQQVADKLHRYHARRKPRPPRYPSLRLQFEREESDRPAKGVLIEAGGHPSALAGTHQALALDSFPEDTAPRPDPGLPKELPEPIAATTAVVGTATAKIIEFPRSWAVPPAPLEELADRVMARPRILEAPALTPPPPALGGITIEAPQKPAAEKRPGIDIPLQSAPLIRRILAAAMDAGIVSGACVLFGFVFWRVAGVRPPKLQVVALALGLGSLFWGVSQYLLIVGSGSTPGLLLTRLELSRFDGTHVNRSLRRWRVLASFLSAASLGMGYLWVFLDEDALCWHDRITHTYLAPKRCQAAK